MRNTVLIKNSIGNISCSNPFLNASVQAIRAKTFIVVSKIFVLKYFSGLTLLDYLLILHQAVGHVVYIHSFIDVLERLSLLLGLDGGHFLSLLLFFFLFISQSLLLSFNIFLLLEKGIS